jgi:hypothetical protein
MARAQSTNGVNGRWQEGKSCFRGTAHTASEGHDRSLFRHGSHGRTDLHLPSPVVRSASRLGRCHLCTQHLVQGSQLK